MSARRGVLRAQRGGVHWTFRLDQGPGPALARVGPWRVTHLERVSAVGGDDSVWLRDLRGRLENDTAVSESEIAERLRAALIDAGATPGKVHWHDVDYPWPRWPEELRLGFPAAGQLWPADVELLGLRLGTRRVAKRDNMTAEARIARIASWSEAGLRVAELGGVVLASDDAAALARAVKAQVNLSEGRDEDAMSALFGEALGYPECCVNAYLSLAARDDAAMIDARLAASTSGPPELGFLIGPLALISHTPCSLSCQASLVLARRLLAAMDAISPGFARRWRRVATGVWGLDAEGKAWVFGGDAAVRVAHSLDGGLRERPAFIGEGLGPSGPSSLPLTFHADRRMT